MMSIDCWHVTDGNTVRGVGRFREETFFVHHLNTIHPILKDNSSSGLSYQFGSKLNQGRKIVQKMEWITSKEFNLDFNQTKVKCTCAGWLQVTSIFPF